MTTQLESDVRQALAGRAAEISPEVVTRLRGIDYRPRARRRTTGLGVTAGLVGAAATAGIVSAVTLGSSEAAFAGWSPTPSAKAAVLTDSSGPEQTCRSRLDIPMSLPGASSVTTPWSVVASDVRGPYTLVVFESGADQATCLTGPSVTAISRTTQGGQNTSVQGSSSSAGGPGHGSASAIAGPGSGDLTWYSELHLNSTDGELTLMDGQVASGVTAVTLERSDGSSVQATVGNGWFVAWWPGDVDSFTAEVTTASGTSSVTLHAAPIPGPPSSGPAVPPGPATCASSAGAPSQVCRVGGFGTIGSSGPSGSSGPTTSGSSGPTS